MNWSLYRFLTISSFNDVCGLQDKLMPFVMELNTHLAQKSRKLIRSREKYGSCKQGFCFTLIKSEPVKAKFNSSCCLCLSLLSLKQYDYFFTSAFEISHKIPLMAHSDTNNIGEKNMGNVVQPSYTLTHCKDTSLLSVHGDCNSIEKSNAILV